jgi:hypothetical protein
MLLSGRNGASSEAIFSSDEQGKTTPATYYPEPELSPTRHATPAARGRRATSLLASGSPAHRPSPTSPSVQSCTVSGSTVAGRASVAMGLGVPKGGGAWWLLLLAGVLLAVAATATAEEASVVGRDPQGVRRMCKRECRWEAGQDERRRRECERQCRQRYSEGSEQLEEEQDDEENAGGKGECRRAVARARVRQSVRAPPTGGGRERGRVPVLPRAVRARARRGRVGEAAVRAAMRAPAGRGGREGGVPLLVPRAVRAEARRGVVGEAAVPGGLSPPGAAAGRW